MAKAEEVTIGRGFKVTRTFKDEWISDVINFDDGLHEPVTITEGTEGIIHSFNTPDGSHMGYVDALYPSRGGFGASEAGMRVQTPIDAIEMT